MEIFHSSIDEWFDDFNLEDLDNFILDKLLHTYSYTLSTFLGMLIPITNTINLIIFHAREDNLVLTFDATHKIRLIIPKEKLIEKIEENPRYPLQTDLSKHRLRLLNPSFDLKIGFNFFTKNFYANFVIVCEDYTKMERIEDNELLKKFRKNEFIEQDKKINETFSKIFQSSQIVEKVLLRVVENDFYGYKSRAEFFQSNELLIVSNKTLAKLNQDEMEEIRLIIKSEYDLNLEITNTQGEENKIKHSLSLNNTCNSNSPHPEMKSETENIISQSSGNIDKISNTRVRKISNIINKKVVTKIVKFNKKPHEIDEELNDNDKRFKSIANPISNEKIQEEKLKSINKIDKQIEDILK